MLDFQEIPFPSTSWGEWGTASLGRRYGGGLPHTSSCSCHAKHWPWWAWLWVGLEERRQEIQPLWALPLAQGPISPQPSLWVSPALKADTPFLVPGKKRKGLEIFCLPSPSHKGFIIFFPFPLLIPLIADVLIKPSNSCYAVLKGTYSSVNQAGLGGGSVRAAN